MATFEELLQRDHREVPNCPGCANYGKRPMQCGCGKGLVHCVWLFRHMDMVHPVHGPINVGDYVCSDGGLLCKGLLKAVPKIDQTIMHEEESPERQVMREAGKFMNYGATPETVAEVLGVKKGKKKP